MICGWAKDRLLFYLSGELDSQETARLLRHLEKCARCTAIAEHLAEVQATINPLLRTNIQPPSTLDARVMDAVRRFPSGRRPWSTFPPMWSWRRHVALLVAIPLLLLVGYVLGRWQSGRSWDEILASFSISKPVLELAAVKADHLLSLSNKAPVHVPGPDPRQVAHGLESRLKFAVVSVDLQAEGAVLRGGRECRLQGIPTAFLQYDFNGERISLFQMEADRIALPARLQPVDNGRCYLVAQMDDMTYILWCAGDRNFVMVARIVPEQLLSLASRAQELPGRSL